MSPSPLRFMAFLAAAAWLSACGVQTASPPSAVPTATPAPATTLPPAKSFTTRTHDGGGVTVKVMPLSLAPRAPLAFDIVMDTHSVDLKDDLLKVAVLRDDTGTAHAPTAWDGDGPGGHHRQGTLKFAALAVSTKTLTLVMKGVAGVPERVFQWTLTE